MLELLSPYGQSDAESIGFEQISPNFITGPPPSLINVTSKVL